MTERETDQMTDWQAMFRKARRYLRFKKMVVRRTPHDYKLYYVEVGSKLMICDMWDVIAQAEALGMPEETTP